MVATILLAISLIGAGLGVCTLRMTTQVLAGWFSGSENPSTPFTHDQLVEAALAIRDYTVGSHDSQELYEMFWNINKTPEEASLNPSYDELRRIFADSDDIHIVDAEAQSHLDDVHNVLVTATVLLVIGTLVMLLCLVYLAIKSGKRGVGSVLFAGGIVALGLFVALGVWALVDFNALFTALHAVFFSQGNWSFPDESLMITALPTGFWAGMGATWLLTSVLLSILMMIIGRILMRNG